MLSMGCQVLKKDFKRRRLCMGYESRLVLILKSKRIDHEDTERESIIPEKKIEFSESDGSGELIDSAQSSSLNSPSPVEQVTNRVGGFAECLNQETIF
uniref:Uncharacterized protein n=1 Tax=Salix viminalis TaxID=40686 RepID=A0A6N2N555_SALVM